MDAKLNRELVLVHNNVGDDRIAKELQSSILKLNDFDDCTVTVYNDTITVSCRGLGGLGSLADCCQWNMFEGPNMRFLGKLRGKLVEFIG